MSDNLAHTMLGKSFEAGNPYLGKHEQSLRFESMFFIAQ